MNPISVPPHWTIVASYIRRKLSAVSLTLTYWVYGSCFQGISSPVSTFLRQDIILPLLSGIAPYSLYTGSAGQGGSLQLRSPLLPSSPPSFLLPHTLRRILTRQNATTVQKNGLEIQNIKLTKITSGNMPSRFFDWHPLSPNFQQHYAPTERSLVDLFPVVLVV